MSPPISRAVCVSTEYGFSMLVPAGTELAEKEWEDGWGGLSAGVEGVELFRLAKLGTKASEEEIQKVGMELTGVPEEASGRRWRPARTATA